MRQKRQVLVTMTESERGLFLQMHTLADQLAELYSTEKALTDPDIIDLSQQLDQLILRWHEDDNKRNRNTEKRRECK